MSQRRMTNKEVAEVFYTVAAMLEIKGEIIHRVLSYQRAGETIEDLARDINDVYAEDALQDLPGIGETLAEKIEELLTTGELEFLERLKQEVPMGVVEMTHVKGVGPKKAALFWKELDITSVAGLKEAAEAGDLRKLPRMGKKSEQNILEGIAALARQTDRLHIGAAYPIAHELLHMLLSLDGVEQGAVAGSLRRYRPTIGDVDILVASSNDPQPIMQTLIDHPDVHTVLASGDTKTSVQLHSGLQVDLRVLPPERYGTLLVYFTGSKDHNVRLRERATQQGLSLNENEFSHIGGDGEPILCATEEEVYKVLDLAWIPPEMREDKGEIEAEELPELITLDDIRGDMQMHTTYSDGKRSVLDMAEAAADRGYEYILITDHSYGLGVVNGLRPEEIDAQRAEIDEANKKLEGRIRVLHGVECEIKADGTLDYTPEERAKFDIVLASLHMSLSQPRDQITERLINAMKDPYVRIIGHPRGRRYPDREPAALDMEAIFEAALAHDVALEINANPLRLDLNASYARRAAELGVKLTISTDAHHPDGFANMHYGVGTARRGWVQAVQVINTWPLGDVLEWARTRRS